MGNLLKDMIEVEKVDNQVINGVDSPNMMSVDSTAPIKTLAPDVIEEEESGKPADEKEKKEEKKPEESEKKPDEEKKEENKEEKKPEEEPAKDAVQKRINIAVKKQRTAERERDWERSRRQEIEEELAKLKSQIPSEDKPKREDFIDDEAYLEALTDWKVDQKLKVKTEVIDKKSEEEQDKEAAQELFELVDGVVEKGRDKYPDFDTVAMDKNLSITQDMMEIIIESELSFELMYYLGKNPDVATEISKMSAMKAAKKFVEIEVEIAKPAKKEEKQEEVKVTPKRKTPEAPDPITPVRSDGLTERDPSKMSAKEYRAWREANK